MAERAKLNNAPAPRKSSSRGSYFVEDKPLEFFSSGCALLDNVIGGGWALGRISNVVGDKSSGKTLLAIEGSANFILSFPKGLVRYAEAEAAFDVGYAEALGMPVASVEFAEGISTVEELFEDMTATLAKLKDRPCLYVIDSLDALSDKAEQERGINDGSYGAAKAKKLGELFRRLVKDIEESRMHLLVISQIRDKIGVTFGETTMRSGGRALDFYASQVIWVADIGKTKKVISGVERVIGVEVRARCKKNKIGLPYRECDFPIIFGYGVDDITAMVEWLMKVRGEEGIAEFGFTKSRYKSSILKLRDEGGPTAGDMRNRLKSHTTKIWREIETGFLPKSRKY